MIFLIFLWLTTWATAPARLSPDVLPQIGLTDCSVRQVVHTSVGGEGLRLTLSNLHSDSTLEIRSVYVARTEASCPQIDIRSAHYLTFGGERSTRLFAETAITSDPVEFRIDPGELLSITVCYGRVPMRMTGHSGSRTTSYVVRGEATPETDFTSAEKKVCWYSIAAIETENPNAEVIAVLGNSITDGRGSTTDMQNRWTDVASETLQKQQIGFINYGIGGNCVVRGGLGPTARERFAGDILGCTGASRIILFEGINDIGGSKDSEATLAALKKEYARFIRRGHEEGKEVYGCTLLPFEGTGYCTPEHEALRVAVNTFIRHEAGFDRVIDTEQFMADPNHPTRIRPEWQEDGLHPNAAGYRAMGEYIARCVDSIPPMQDVLGRYFRIGVAVNTHTVAHSRSKAHRVVTHHYNSIVAENCMKPESLCPRPWEWHWEDADAFVAMGEQNGQQVIGHCLIWHSQTPDWLFVDEDGNEVDRHELLRRMKRYITTVVGRYKGRIAGWDVVNEAVLDDGTLRDSRWRRIIGDDYIAYAFRYAHAADKNAELYYNDYSMSSPRKNAAVCRMVRALQKQKIRIDAVGMQSHNGMDWPNLEQYEAAIDSLSATGVKVIISELDLNVLPNPEEFSGAEVSQFFEYTPEMDPYANGMDEATRQAIFERWLSLFRIYYAHRDQIARVTFWGVGDKDSWMGDWPIPGRHAYATLFDEHYNPKAVVRQILKIYE